MSENSGSPIYDETTGWYQEWYFVLRLEEELSRATRYHLSLTLLTIQLRSVAIDDLSDIQRILRSIQRHKLRRSDIAAMLSGQELVICLTHTAADQAPPVIARIVKSLSRYDPLAGSATFPDDSSEAAQLIRIAATRARPVG